MGQRRTQLSQLYVGFLSRRVKRLLPALSVCVAVTALVVLATDPFPRHSIQTGVGALFGLANVLLFFFELDYFSPSSIFNAFTHTWSLGVEEQFYVVFPMFVWLFYFRTHFDADENLGAGHWSTRLSGIQTYSFGAVARHSEKARSFCPVDVNRVFPRARTTCDADYIGSRRSHRAASGYKRSFSCGSLVGASAGRIHRTDFLLALFVALADYRARPDRVSGIVAIISYLRSCHDCGRSAFLSLDRETPAIQNLDDSQNP